MIFHHEEHEVEINSFRGSKVQFGKLDQANLRFGANLVIPEKHL